MQSVTTNNLSLDVPIIKKAWSLVFIGVVWAEFKLLAGVVLIISFGPGSCAGKVGVYGVEPKQIKWLIRQRLPVNVWGTLHLQMVQIVPS